MKTQEEKKAFYEECANILEIEHEYNTPVHKRTRWNTRNLGNGRYPGFGLVQCFGSSMRVVSRNGTRIFNEYEDVYAYLKELKA
jgi:hypothetical protein